MAQQINISTLSDLHLGTLRHGAKKVGRFMILLPFALMTFHGSVAAQGQWDNLFTLPGLNDYAPALAVDDSGNLYAGGTFTTAGGQPANGIAMFDGDKWSPLGSGIDGDGWFTASAIAIDSTGTVFVGGVFSQAGGLSVNNIAQWTGGSWHALGEGIDGEVLAMAIDSHGNLFAAGSFTRAGGQAAANIAKWDGSAWSAVGSGTNGGVHELAFDSKDNLYAAGPFDSAGGVEVNHLARWNGAQWEDVGSPLSSSGEALTVDSFDNVFAADQSTVYKYDGSNWVQQGNSFGNMPDALLVDQAGQLYVAGGFNSAFGDPVDGIARLDGSTWVQLGRGMSWAFALAQDAVGNIYVTNDSPSLEGSNGIRFGYIAKWDGSAFSGVGPGAGGPWPIQDLAVDRNKDLYVAGGFHYAGFVPAKYVAMWDGKEWNAFGDGPKGPANAIALAGSGGVYAAGEYRSEDGSISYGYVSEWNGSNWTDLAAQTDSPGGSLVYDIQPGSSETIYAAGYFANVDGTAANNIAFWSGSAWSSLGQGLDGAAYAVIVDDDGNVYAGGAFSEAGGIAAAHVAKWDGSTWSALGAGPGGEVGTLTIDKRGTLFAGGQFGTAKWDGTSWTILDSTFGKMSAADVNALATDEYGRVYAGGYFSSLGGTSANNLAVWDGASWSPLGSGTDGSVNALSVYGGNEVFAAGEFENVGGSESVGLGLWVAEATTIESPTLLAPPDGSVDVPPFAELSWQPVDDVIGYHLQVATDESFGATLVDDSTLVEATWTTIDPLPYSTTFYWHVRAGRDDGLGKSTGVFYGPWSEARSFTTAVGTAAEDNPSIPPEFALHPAYPNPFNPDRVGTTISFDLPEAANVRIVIFDALGRVVESMVDGRWSAGRHKVDWVAGNVPSGVYFVRFEAGPHVITSRLLIVK